MKVYLAGPWEHRAEMPALAARLEREGYTITERWWEYEDHAGWAGFSNEPDGYMEERAIADFMGVVRSDALIVVNTRKSEGKAVEQGVAVAGGKPVILIGTRSNIFHYLPNVYPVADIEAAIEMLQ